MASITMACCPMALQMMILASDQKFLICFTASIPSISGIVISMVTRSGCILLIFF